MTIPTSRFESRRVGPVIAPGVIYRYTCDLPRGCKDALYRVDRFVLDVPSYQQKVLVECLTVRDAGLWFTTTCANFAVRYAAVENTPVADRNEEETGEVST